MVSVGPRKRAWFAAVCLALLAQAVPKAVCGTCVQRCCGGTETESSASSAGIRDDIAGACPHCAAADDHCPTGTDEQPCRCQLSSRPGQPIASPRGFFPTFDGGAPGAVARDAASLAPPVLAASREYLAAALAVPIRPARILLGVWRN